jgi:uncharacterized membrane protein
MTRQSWWQVVGGWILAVLVVGVVVYIGVVALSPAVARMLGGEK